MLIAAIGAVDKVLLEQHVRCGIPTLAAHRRYRTRCCYREVGRQRYPEAPSAGSIVADAFAGDKAEQEVVFRPPEPSGFDIAAEMAAIAEKLARNEFAVIDIVRNEDASKIHMPPGLRPIGRNGGDG